MKNVFIDNVPLNDVTYKLYLSELINTPEDKFAIRIIQAFGLDRFYNEGIELKILYDWADRNYLPFKKFLMKKYNIKEKEAYCCNDFKYFFTKSGQGLYYFYTNCLLPPMLAVYCPFCGRKLSDDI